MSAGAAAAGIQMAGAMLGGLEQRSALRAQARVHDENARLSLLAGEEAAAQTARDERQSAGAAIAAMAESGFVPGTGTPLDLIQQSALERELEIGNIRAQAQGEARNHRMAAYDARRAGRAALIGGVAGAAAAAGDFASQRSSQRRLDRIAANERSYRLGLQRQPGIVAEARALGLPAWGVRPRLRVLGPPAD